MILFMENKFRNSKSIEKEKAGVGIGKNEQEDISEGQTVLELWWWLYNLVNVLNITEEQGLKAKTIFKKKWAPSFSHEEYETQRERNPSSCAASPAFLQDRAVSPDCMPGL